MVHSANVCRPAHCLALLLCASTASVQAAVVLQYHHVSESTPASTSTSPERFAMHLDVLAEQGFEAVPLQRLVDLLRFGRPLPDKAAAITFDDGYLSIYTTAYPLLRAKGWPFTVFVNTDPHDREQRGYMTWDQLRELREGGATIANHTVSHAHLLDRAAAGDEPGWRASVASEISGAQERIERQIGSAPLLLAYPYGEYDRAVLEIAASLGYAGFGQQSGPLAEYSDLQALPRYPFGGPYGDRDDFLTKINSLPLPLAPGPDAIRLETADGRPLTDMVLDGPARRPRLVLQLPNRFPARSLSCFATGQGQIGVTLQESRAIVQPEKALPEGRSRFNCTAPSAEPGRFYWYSQPWIVGQPND